MTLLYSKESYIIRGAVKESVYQNALKIALAKKGLRVKKDKKINIFYENENIGTYIPDLIVNNKILIELKVKPYIHKDDLKQFWHYLKNTDFRLGFLINFGGSDGVEIVRRVYDTARNKSISA